MVFVKENTPVDTIYIIGRGMIKATDYRIYGITYDFMRFEGVYAMGGMEVIMDLDRYCTTLETVTPCTIVKIAKEKYARWLNSDIRALKLEAKIMGHYLFEQGKNSRAFLFYKEQTGWHSILWKLIQNMQKMAFCMWTVPVRTFGIFRALCEDDQQGGKEIRGEWMDYEKRK